MAEAGSHRRVFFALWPGADAQESLDAAARLGVMHCGGRRMRRDSLHMTLAFIGAVTPVQLERLHLIAEEIRTMPFDLSLDHFGYWSHKRILWAGCHASPAGLQRLVKALAEELPAAGFAIEDRAVVPHVTLVRHARCTRMPVLDHPVLWPVSEFSLVESFLQPSGARYRTLACWQLSEST